MRVAQLLPYDADFHGGVREVVVHLSRQLDRLGHETTIFGPTERETLELDFPRLEPIRTNPVVLPANGSVARIIGLDPKAWEWVTRRLIDERYDVVHLQEPILWLPILYGIPPESTVVGTFHAAGDLEDLGDLSELAWPVLSGLMARLDAGGESSQLRELSNLARPMVSSMLTWLDGAAGVGRIGDLARPVVGRVLARLDAAVAVSNSARGFAESYGVSVGPIIPNGVETSLLERATDIERSSAPTILFFSRLDERKGLDTLLRAMPDVQRRVPSARLLVAGNFATSDDLAIHYRTLADELGAACEFVPSPSADEKVRLFGTATALCAPATGQESFGIILAEAMAAGLPIVASDIPGYRDVLEDGRLGLLAPPGDEAALANALTRLLTDAGLRAELAEMGRTKAATLSWEVVASQVAELYAVTRRARSAPVVEPPRPR
jgi:phosphatidylinositol alpha-mannosyltransferase